VSATGGFLLLLLADHALGGEQHAGDGSGVLQGHAGHLGGVDHACGKQVLVLLGAGVEAEVGLAVAHFLHHDAAFHAGVGHDLAEGLL
jgi:hypothetical protein